MIFEDDRIGGDVQHPQKGTFTNPWYLIYWICTQFDIETDRFVDDLPGTCLADFARSSPSCDEAQNAMAVQRFLHLFPGKKGFKWFQCVLNSSEIQCSRRQKNFRCLVFPSKHQRAFLAGFVLPIVQTLPGKPRCPPAALVGAQKPGRLTWHLHNPFPLIWNTPKNLC